MEHINFPSFCVFHQDGAVSKRFSVDSWKEFESFVQQFKQNNVIFSVHNKITDVYYVYDFEGREDAQEIIQFHKELYSKEEVK